MNCINKLTLRNENRNKAYCHYCLKNLLLIEINLIVY